MKKELIITLLKETIITNIIIDNLEKEIDEIICLLPFPEVDDYYHIKVEELKQMELIKQAHMDMTIDYCKRYNYSETEKKQLFNEATKRAARQLEIKLTGSL